MVSAIDHAVLVVHGAAVIKANQASSGAYVASPNFPVYRYSWLRDGAFIAEAMSRLGEIESAEAFFGWCARIVAEQAPRTNELIVRHGRGETIAQAEFLPTRYAVDGRPAGEAWADFQLDGYGTWLWALDRHLRRHGRSVEQFRLGALTSARYSATFWEQPCYDWWEEQPNERHPSTLGALAAGLSAASAWTSDAHERAHWARTADEIAFVIRHDAQRAGHIAKSLGGDSIDASTIAVATPFDVLPPAEPLVEATVARVEHDLVTPAGGVHRHLEDTYYGGGEWLLLAGFLGWHYARTGRAAAARRELDWIASCAAPNGDLPEQVPNNLLAPAEFDVWVQRWGPVASPLLWSHAMHVILADELGVNA
jgi:GH15 family glucan-1,4-alpha-glucosidase